MFFYFYFVLSSKAKTKEVGIHLYLLGLFPVEEHVVIGCYNQANVAEKTIATIINKFKYVLQQPKRENSHEHRF